MPIQDVMPECHANEYHHIAVSAPPERVYDVMRQADFFDSPITRALFSLRGLSGLLTGKRAKRPVFNIDAFLRSGFVLLHEAPPREIILGMVERLGKAKSPPQEVDAASFSSFDYPGYSKYVWGISVTQQADGSTRLATETRIWCNDEATRQRFLRYWFFIRPFSGLTRIAFLRAIKRQVEGV